MIIIQVQDNPLLCMACFIPFTGPGSYQERPPHYLDSGDQPPYDEDAPGQYFDDRMGPSSLNGPPSREAYPEDGQRTPSVNGGSKWTLNLDKCYKHIPY